MRSGIELSIVFVAAVSVAGACMPFSFRVDAGGAAPPADAGAVDAGSESGGEGEGEPGEGEGEGEDRIVLYDLVDGGFVRRVLDVPLRPYFAFDAWSVLDVDADGSAELVLDAHDHLEIVSDLAGVPSVAALGLRARPGNAVGLDLDGDLDRDLLVGTAEGATALLRDGDELTAVPLVPPSNGVLGPGGAEQCGSDGATTTCFRDLRAIAISDRDHDGDLDVALLGRQAWVVEQTAPGTFAATHVLDRFETTGDDYAQYVLTHAVVVDDVVYASGWATVTRQGSGIRHGLFALTATGPLEVLAARAERADARVVERAPDGGAHVCVGGSVRKMSALLVDEGQVLGACPWLYADVDGDGAREAVLGDDVVTVESGQLGDVVATIGWAPYQDAFVGDVDGDGDDELLDVEWVLP